MLKGFQVCMSLSLGDFVLYVWIQLLQHCLFRICIILQIRVGFLDSAYFLTWIPESATYYPCNFRPVSSSELFYFSSTKGEQLEYSTSKCTMRTEKHTVVQVPGADPVHLVLILLIISTLPMFKERRLGWACGLGL